MARIREKTKNTLQLGIRSMSKPEAIRIKKENISLYTTHMMRKNDFNIDDEIKKLPSPIFITFDVDVFD